MRLDADERRRFLDVGAHVVRGYFTPAEAAALKAAAAARHEERERQAERGELDPAFNPMRRLQTVFLQELMMDGEPALLWVATPCLEIARDYLGHEPEHHPDSFVRRVGPDNTAGYLPFHQDEMIIQRPCLNIWIALDRAGDDAPGLEIVPRSFGEVLSSAGAHTADIKFSVPDGAVVSRFGDGPFWCPVFQPGDAAIFFGATLHRTHVEPTMTRARFSVEARLI